MAEATPDHVSIIFHERDGKPTIPVGGAWGGPNGQNEVVAHVFIEHGAIPSIMTVDVDDQGRADFENANTIKRGDIIREVQATLVMSPEVAASFGRWLMEKAQLAIQNRESGSK